MNRRTYTGQGGDSSAADQSFSHLGPEQVLQVVEERLNVRLSNLFRPLNSYINRVYELQDQDGNGLVAKFYRPGRWSQQALQEEHAFLLELQAAELPVIAPLEQVSGSTLGSYGQGYFAVFKKRGGRSIDEFTDLQWLQLGRLIGRVHLVGSRSKATHRPIMRPAESTRRQLEYLLGCELVPPEVRPALHELVQALIAETGPLFDRFPLIRIHGDCHFGNILHRPDESLLLIDFDDMVMGPPVQDLWMLLPGPPEEAVVELDFFLEGYETFSTFDRRSLVLIEPLRAMRFIHYMAWCAHQVAADGLTRVIDDFGSHDYWRRELADLGDQLERIRKSPGPQGNW